MIHECLLVVWVMVVVTWLLSKHWLGGHDDDSSKQEVMLPATDSQPPNGYQQQVTYLYFILVAIRQVTT